jgi:hypothetical protein
MAVAAVAAHSSPAPPASRRTAGDSRGPRNGPPGVPGPEPGGLRGQMSWIDAKSSGANSLFFTIRGMNHIPRMARAGRRRRPIFFADNHLGRHARLTSVGIDEKNAPLTRDGMDFSAGRYLAQCPKGPTPMETLLQSAGNSPSTVCFRATRFCTLSFFQGDFWDNVVFRCSSRHNVLGALL